MAWHVGEVCPEGVPAPGPGSEGQRGLQGRLGAVFFWGWPGAAEQPAGLQVCAEPSTAGHSRVTQPQQGLGQAPTPARLG